MSTIELTVFDPGFALALYRAGVWPLDGRTAARGYLAFRLGPEGAQRALAVLLDMIETAPNHHMDIDDLVTSLWSCGVGVR